MKYIDFEAHFLSSALEQALRARSEAPCLTENDTMIFGPDCALPYGPLLLRLKDLSDRRIAEMDAAGIDIQVVSCVGGIELLPAELATEVARKSNDELFAAIQAHPDRLRGYAILAPTTVPAACAELERCVKELGFVGWNAFSNFGPDALDDPKYIPLLEKAAELGIFVYLHPTMSFIDRLHGFGRQLIGSCLGFGIDVMITATRLILSGTFDRFPDLKLVLGHMGEGFPYIMDRMRARGPKNARKPALNELEPKEYFGRNIYVTTSGHYSAPAFRCAQEVLGTERILLGSDYPMEPLSAAVQFMNALPISEADRAAVCAENAARVFQL